MPRGWQERAVRRGARQLARRLEGWSRFGAIDMERTLAFSEELNYAPSIWLNVRGREPLGVLAAESYDATVATLTARLLAWRHPLTGRRIVRAVHRRDALYAGPHVAEAPDLVLELETEGGYSYVCLPSDERATGSVRTLAPEEYVAGKGGGMNGSHRAEGLWALAGPNVVEGRRAEASIVDVAPTIMHLAGLAVPAWMDGRLLPGVAGEPTIGTDGDGTPLAGPLGRPAAGDGDELWRRLAALGYLEGRA